MSSQETIEIYLLRDHQERARQTNLSVECLWDDWDLADYLRISVYTVANRVSQGLDMPPHVKLGGKRRWIPASARKWVNSKESCSEAMPRQRPRQRRRHCNHDTNSVQRQTQALNAVRPTPGGRHGD